MSDEAQQERWDEQIREIRNQPEPWGTFVRAMLDGVRCSYLDDGKMTRVQGWADVYITEVSAGYGYIKVVQPYDRDMSQPSTKVTDLSRIRLPV